MSASAAVRRSRVCVSIFVLRTDDVLQTWYVYYKICISSIFLCTHTYRGFLVLRAVSLRSTPFSTIYVCMHSGCSSVHHLNIKWKFISKGKRMKTKNKKKNTCILGVRARSRQNRRCTSIVQYFIRRYDRQRSLSPAKWPTMTYAVPWAVIGGCRLHRHNSNSTFWQDQEKWGTTQNLTINICCNHFEYWPLTPAEFLFNSRINLRVWHILRISSTLSRFYRMMRGSQLDSGCMLQHLNWTRNRTISVNGILSMTQYLCAPHTNIIIWSLIGSRMVMALVECNYR